MVEENRCWRVGSCRAVLSARMSPDGTCKHFVRGILTAWLAARNKVKNGAVVPRCEGSAPRPRPRRSHEQQRRACRKRVGLLDCALLALCPPLPRFLELRSLARALIALTHVLAAVALRLAAVLLPAWLYCVRELHRRGDNASAMAMFVAGLAAVLVADALHSRHAANAYLSQLNLVVGSGAGGEAGASGDSQNLHLLQAYVPSQLPGAPSRETQRNGSLELHAAASAQAAAAVAAAPAEGAAAVEGGSAGVPPGFAPEGSKAQVRPS